MQCKDKTDGEREQKMAKQLVTNLLCDLGAEIGMQFLSQAPVLYPIH